jgi:hypothetical protein
MSNHTIHELHVDDSPDGEPLGIGPVRAWELQRDGRIVLSEIVVIYTYNVGPGSKKKKVWQAILEGEERP